MSRPRIAFLLIAGVITLLFIIKSVAIVQARPPRGPVLQIGSRMKGDPQAPVKVIEFTDFQCPACAKTNGIFDDILKKYPGKIFVDHRHFPLGMHAHARRASLFAECAAAQGKFWPMQDVLFKSQTSWAQMGSVDSYFGTLGVSLGMDGMRLTACVNSPATEQTILKDIADGNRRGVNSTPTFFVNGKIAVGSVQLAAAIEELLGKK